MANCNLDTLKLETRETGIVYDYFQFGIDEDTENHIVPIGKNKGIIVNQNGEIYCFTHKMGSKEAKVALVHTIEEGDAWISAIPCKSHGAAILTSSYFKICLAYPNGTVRHLTDAEPLNNMVARTTRLNAEETCLGMSVNFCGHQAVKLYPRFDEHLLGPEDSIIIKPIEWTEENKRIKITDFVITTDTVISITSNGYLTVHSFTGELLSSHQVYPEKDGEWTYEADCIKLSSDFKRLAVMCSTGTPTLRCYKVRILDIEGNKVTQTAESFIKTGARGVLINAFMKRTDGSYVIVSSNDHKDTCIFVVEPEGKFTFIERNEDLDFGMKNCCEVDGTLWVVDARFTALRITGF